MREVKKKEKKGPLGFLMVYVHNVGDAITGTRAVRIASSIQFASLHLTNLFFLKNGGKALDNMAKRIEVLSKRYNFYFVNSTDIRKAVATQATKRHNHSALDTTIQQHCHVIGMCPTNVCV